MPLNCDCYAGCWGDHSAGWPEVHDPNKEYRKAAVSHLEYGTYVYMPGDIVRVEGTERMEKLKSIVAAASDKGADE